MPTTNACPDGATLDALRSGLDAIYRDLQEELAASGVSCALSGRCCRFAEYGHTLFLTAAEALRLRADAPSPARPLDEGQTCPWQDGSGRCTARESRPLGCRVFFCEPRFQEPSQELSERYLSRLKALTRDLGLPWNYAPLHSHLRGWGWPAGGGEAGGTSDA